MSSPAASRSIIYRGLDVHKDSVTIAVLPADAAPPTRIDTYQNDLPVKPGVQRTHDRYDAGQRAPRYRAGDLTVIRIPSEAEESVRDVVRCRETLQRDVVTPRHEILKFLSRRWAAGADASLAPHRETAQTACIAPPDIGWSGSLARRSRFRIAMLYRVRVNAVSAARARST